MISLSHTFKAGGLFVLLATCLLSACSSGPRPVVLPDGFFRSEINQQREVTTPRASVDPLNLEGEGVAIKSVGEPVLAPAVKTSTVDLVVESKPLIPERVWTLVKGETIRSELTKWAKDSDWSVVWQLDKDWVIPSNSDFSGAFDVAASKVIETLASNGVLIHANFYSANKTMVVTGPGVTPQ